MQSGLPCAMRAPAEAFSCARNCVDNSESGAQYGSTHLTVDLKSCAPIHSLGNAADTSHYVYRLDLLSMRTKPLFDGYLNIVSLFSLVPGATGIIIISSHRK